MSGYFGRRLYTNIWRRADPLCLRTEQPNSPWSFFEHTRRSDAIHGLSRSNWTRAFTSSTSNHGKQTSTNFASGRFPVLGVHSTSTVAEWGPTCVILSGRVGHHGGPNSLDRLGFDILVRSSWRRNFQTLKPGSPSKESEDDKDNKDSSSNHSGFHTRTTDRSKPESEQLLKQIGSECAQASATPVHGKNLMDRLPHMHRPTREELLAAATGFWSRLKVRFKWFSIRSVRPFNMDEIGALFSWFLLGHVLWVILGTTTFFSLLILAINTVFAQETLARWVGNYLTKSSGVKVVFESAIVPKWRDGVITFKNVFVSRRPGQGSGNVSKGSSKTAAAAAAAAAALDDRAKETQPRRDVLGEDEEDTNYTQFDVSIEAVNVTLSFTKWFNGKGPLRDVEVRGIRGVVDRTQVHWLDDDSDPKSYRREHNPGDFEIDSFKMEDVLVTVYQSGNFRPFPVSIFSCDLPQLRRQWLFYDFLSANMMSGSFDNSLFTIHPRQTHSCTGAQLNNGVEENGKSNPWKKHSRIRIDGLNIDHLNRGVQGPFSWIHEGNVDIVADIMFPADNDESLAKVMSDFYERLEAAVTSNRYQPAPRDRISINEAQAGGVVPVVLSEGDKRFVVTDLRIHLNNVKAVVPIFTRDLSYINNALIRPIVAYINSKHTFIPIYCRLVKRVCDFDGSWTIFDSGLMDDLSAQTYEAFARDVTDDQARKRRFKKVGLWSLQLAAQAIFMSMAGNIA